jgi:hypothetical protein
MQGGGKSYLAPQRLNLEQEIHNTASKLCILGFEPLEWSLGDMPIPIASWLATMLTDHLQAHHIFYPL